ESGVLKVPFIRIEGWSARYGMTLQATSMEPVPRFRVTQRYQHSLGFLEVPDHRVRLVATGYNGEYLGLVGHPGQQEPFGLCFAVDTTDSATDLVLTLDSGGMVYGLDASDDGILLVSNNPPHIVVNDDVHVTMASAARVRASVACNSQRAAKDDLKVALQ